MQLFLHPPFLLYSSPYFTHHQVSFQVFLLSFFPHSLSVTSSPSLHSYLSFNLFFILLSLTTQHPSLFVSFSFPFLHTTAYSLLHLSFTSPSPLLHLNTKLGRYSERNFYYGPPTCRSKRHGQGNTKINLHDQIRKWILNWDENMKNTTRGRR